jgi:hypothetical protein
MKKEATTKNERGLFKKTSNKKTVNPKMQGTQNKRPPMKRKVTPKSKGLKTKDL